MKRMIFLATVAAALLAFSACDKKTSDDLKQKAEDAKQKVETKAKEAKEAADRQIEKAKPKLKELGDKAKEATKDAQPKLEELGEEGEGRNAGRDRENKAGGWLRRRKPKECHQRVACRGKSDADPVTAAQQRIRAKHDR